MPPDPPGRLILASASPRRRELLCSLGWPFDIAAAEIDESPLHGEGPADMARRLALRKALTVASTHPHCLIVAADTIVVLGDAVLGKPESPEAAREMLDRLRARSHLVLTGLALVSPDGRSQVHVAETPVRMRDYATTEVERYVASGDALDKAGAYAIQHGEFAPVESLEDCYANVVGLPLCHLYRAFALWGCTPPQHPRDACPWARAHGGCSWMAAILGRPDLDRSGDRR